MVTTKFDPTLKPKLIEALRSGRFDQGENALCLLDGRMCCLGVAEHVRDNSRWSDLPDNGNYEDERKLFKGIPIKDSEGNILYYQTAMLTEETRDAYGFRAINGTCDLSKIPPELQKKLTDIIRTNNGYESFDLGHITTLMGLNDLKVPFNLIADVIETGAADAVHD